MPRVVIGGVLVLLVVFLIWRPDQTEDADGKAPTSSSDADVTDSIGGSAHAPKPQAGDDTPPADVQPTASRPQDAGKIAPKSRDIFAPVNMRMPAQVARSALKALQDRDFDALIALVPPTHQASARERWGPGTERYVSLFGDTGWQRASLNAWDGTFSEFRQKRGVLFLAKYGEIQSEGVRKHIAVSLLNFDRDGHWYFKDLDDRDDDSYLKYGEVVAEDYTLTVPDTE